ncbi:MAG: DUF3299 domain-containing protein [Chromatiaceae bacterium]|nr:MAG: DUF3299 domain-containing protein [Chromatiaceae bacterium]
MWQCPTLPPRGGCPGAAFPSGAGHRDQGYRGAWLILILTLLLVACGDGPPGLATGGDPQADRLPVAVAAGQDSVSDPAQGGGERVRKLTWDALIPTDYRPPDPLAGLETAHIADDDPRAPALLQRLLATGAEAPVVESLHGQRIRLGGFVVPLECDGHVLREFLLVPYEGACIHVPPPPANQIVHVLVVAPAGAAAGLFDAAWVTGRLETETSASVHGSAGYRLHAEQVLPF